MRRADLPTCKESLRLQLHAAARGKTANARHVISQQIAVTEKRFLDRPKSFVYRRAIRRNSSFVILASSLVGSCFVASKQEQEQEQEQEHEQEAGLQRIYAS